MNHQSTKTEGGASERQARKKKRILIALAGVTLLTWSRTMLGGDSEPADAAAAKTAARGPTAASAAAGARPAGRTIQTFDQASERMKIWPAAIERRAIAGAIADLAPAYWMTGSSEPEAEPAPAADDEAPVLARFAPSAEPEVLPLRLRSTALLGDKRYAVIGNVRYSEGDLVQVPGVGEFLIESVGSREAVLRKGERTWTLSIQNVLAGDDL